MCEINFQATEAEKKLGGVSQETGMSGRNDGNSGCGAGPASPDACYAGIALQVTHCEPTARGAIASAWVSDSERAATFFS